MHWSAHRQCAALHHGPDGEHHAICQGVKRFRVLQFVDGYPFTAARVQLIDESEQFDPDIEGRAHSSAARGRDIAAAAAGARRNGHRPEGRGGAARLADFIAGLMDISADEKQKLLESFDLRTRLDRLLELLSHRIEVLKVSREIDQRPKSRSTTETASMCCVSRCARSRRSLARTTRRGRNRRTRQGDRRSENAGGSGKAGAQGTQAPRAHARGAGEYSMIRTYLTG